MKAIKSGICFLFIGIASAMSGYAQTVTKGPPVAPPPIINVVIPHIVTVADRCDRLSSKTTVYGKYLYFFCEGQNTNPNIPNAPDFVFLYVPVDDPRAGLFLQMYSAPYWAQQFPTVAGGDNFYINGWPVDVVYDAKDDSGDVGRPPTMVNPEYPTIHRIIMMTSTGSPF